MRVNIRLLRLEKTKYVKDAFCQTLSDIPWSKSYQCSCANDMFNLFVYLLSSAVEKQAPFKNVFLKKKTLKLFKKTWFDGECKNLLHERQGSWPMKNTSRFHHLKIGLLIITYDWNYRLSWKENKNNFLELFQLSQMFKRPLELYKHCKGSKSIS